MHGDTVCDVFSVVYRGVIVVGRAFDRRIDGGEFSRYFNRSCHRCIGNGVTACDISLSGSRVGSGRVFSTDRNSQCRTGFHPETSLWIEGYDLLLIDIIFFTYSIKSLSFSDLMVYNARFTRLSLGIIGFDDNRFAVAEFIDGKIKRITSFQLSAAAGLLSTS